MLPDCGLSKFEIAFFVHIGQNEYDLKTKLLSKYIKTVRPVKNFSDIVQVKFDIALRTVVDLVSCLPHMYELRAVY